MPIFVMRPVIQASFNPAFMSEVKINQSVAILIDGNNIEKSLHEVIGADNAMPNFDTLIPKLVGNRSLSRLMYFREGQNISSKLAERLREHYHGSVAPCHKSADIPLAINAIQISQKVDTIIILSGDSDYVELVRHLRFDGIRVEIAAVKATTAKILIEEAEHFTPIEAEDCFTYDKPSKGRKQGKTTPPRTPGKKKSKPQEPATAKKTSRN